MAWENPFHKEGLITNCAWVIWANKLEADTFWNKTTDPGSFTITNLIYPSPVTDSYANVDLWLISCRQIVLFILFYFQTYDNFWSFSRVPISIDPNKIRELWLPFFTWNCSGLYNS